MNEQLIQSTISSLGETIAQLNITLSMERAQFGQLVEELEATKAELEKLKTSNKTEEAIDNE